MVPGEKYHLYNHSIGKENLFTAQKNYDFFLKNMAKHILPVCKLFGYCMMPNHFHLVLQVREAEALHKLWQKEPNSPLLSQKQLELKTSKSFANLFSSYTQAYNKLYDRMGSLFIPSMKMVTIEDDGQFCKAVHYTHSNPVHHGFTKSIGHWPNSSYRIFLSNSPTKLERDFVLEKFGGLDAFIKYHEQPVDLKYKFPEKYFQFLNFGQLWTTLAKFRIYVKLLKTNFSKVDHLI